MGVVPQPPSNTCNGVAPGHGLVASGVAPPSNRDVVVMGTRVSPGRLERRSGRLLSLVYPRTRYLRHPPLLFNLETLTRVRFPLMSVTKVWGISSFHSVCMVLACCGMWDWSLKTNPTELCPSSAPSPLLSRHGILSLSSPPPPPPELLFALSLFTVTTL